jgi:hypothetical protein
MSKLRVNCLAISLDGYGAGPIQNEQNALGKNGTDLHQWFYPTSPTTHVSGSGEHVLQNLNLRALGYRVSAHVAGENVTHASFERVGNLPGSAAEIAQ